jgi:hypothetical protein
MDKRADLGRRRFTQAMNDRCGGFRQSTGEATPGAVGLASLAQWPCFKTVIGLFQLAAVETQALDWTYRGLRRSYGVGRGVAPEAAAGIFHASPR